MQELSLNVLDIAQNSIRAGADLITIRVEERTADHFMEISVSDNGCGMSEEQVARVKDPFFTTRITRKVGLGVPLFRMSAESTGGSFDIESELGVGTKTTARYCTDHLDMLPLGDMTATMTSLISVNPDLDFLYIRSVDDQSFTLDTRELRAVLEGVPLNTPEILIFIRDMIDENTAALTV